MKKNLTQAETKKEIIERINKLKPGEAKQWGKMNVNQMLLHGYEGLRIAYGDNIVTVKKMGKLSAMMLRFFILKTDFPTPKEQAETFPEINMVARGINPQNFDEVKNKLIEAVNKFPEKPTLPIHPFMGKFTTENWGRLNYTHLHHHLLQFGV